LLMYFESFFYFIFFSLKKHFERNIKINKL
jgi:hypothetical protein